MTDELLSINGNLGVLARLTGEIKPLVFWAGDPLALRGACRRQACAKAKAGGAKTGTEWALGLHPLLESHPPERQVDGGAALPVLTAHPKEAGLPRMKPWALTLQVTLPHLCFFQELLPTRGASFERLTLLHVTALTTSSSPWGWAWAAGESYPHTSSSEHSPAWGLVMDTQLLVRASGSLLTWLWALLSLLKQLANPAIISL